MCVACSHIWCMSLPDFIHKITVQASPGLEKRRNSPDLGTGTSPSFGPRFRAIQRECGLHPPHTLSSHRHTPLHQTHIILFFTSTRSPHSALTFSALSLQTSSLPLTHPFTTIAVPVQISFLLTMDQQRICFSL